ncbi:MAG: winged helix-turn-helix transcriptional regulator [Thermoplasmata archaeon]
MGFELEYQRKIYETIVNNPGIHFRELSRITNIQIGVLEYHLHNLEKSELIVSKIDGKYRRYYASNTHSPEERYILGILRQDIPRRIVIILLEKKLVSAKDINKELKLTNASLAYYLKKLLNYNIIEYKIENDEKLYFSKSPEKIANVLIRYRRTFIDKLIDSFVDLWLSDK